MCRRPFRSHSIHICTSARSLHNGDVGACVAVHQEWGQTSKPRWWNELQMTTTRGEKEQKNKKKEEKRKAGMGRVPGVPLKVYRVVIIIRSCPGR